jgi:hypothetical protein
MARPGRCRPALVATPYYRPYCCPVSPVIGTVINGLPTPVESWVSRHIKFRAMVAPLSPWYFRRQRPLPLSLGPALAKTTLVRPAFAEVLSTAFYKVTPSPRSRLAVTRVYLSPSTPPRTAVARSVGGPRKSLAAKLTSSGGLVRLEHQFATRVLLSAYLPYKI